MTKPVVSFRTLSNWAYVLSFGALFGYATNGYTINLSDGSKDTGLLYVWIISGFVGSLLIAIKNRRITDKRLRTIVSLADVAVLAGALLLIALLPGEVGMLKGLALFVLFFPYLVWYRKSEHRLVLGVR